MLTGRAAAPGAAPSPACCMGFGLFRAKFVACSFFIAYPCVQYAPMEFLINSAQNELRGKYVVM